MNPEIDQDKTEAVQTARPVPLAWLIPAPFLLCFLMWLVVPGYVIPLLNDRIGRLLFLALIIWHLVGSFFIWRGSPSFRRTGTLVFTLPIVLLLVLGPAFKMVAH